MRVWFRMCPEDRDQYGGDEWVLFDDEALKNLPGSTLMDIEAVTGFQIVNFYNERIDSAHGMRARLWVARKLTGTLVDDWEKFDPKILLVDTRSRRPQKPADADPPDGASETGSEAAPS